MNTTEMNMPTKSKAQTLVHSQMARQAIIARRNAEKYMTEDERLRQAVDAVQEAMHGSLMEYDKLVEAIRDMLITAAVSAGLFYEELRATWSSMAILILLKRDSARGGRILHVVTKISHEYARLYEWDEAETTRHEKFGAIIEALIRGIVFADAHTCCNYVRVFWDAANDALDAMYEALRTGDKSVAPLKELRRRWR